MSRSQGCARTGPWIWAPGSIGVRRSCFYFVLWRGGRGGEEKLFMRREQERILSIRIVFEMKYLLMNNCKRGLPVHQEAKASLSLRLHLLVNSGSLTLQTCAEVKKVGGTTTFLGFVSWLCCFLAG